MDDQLAKIEKMLADGMSEEQILAALGVQQKPSTPYSRLEGGSAMGAQRMGPTPPDRTSGLVKFAKEMMGIADPMSMSDDEMAGTIPLPFTNQRLKPGTASLGAMNVASGVQFARAIPSFIRNLLGAARPPAPFQPSIPHPPPAIEPPNPFGPSIPGGMPKPPIPDAAPPVEQIPSPMREWLAESMRGTPSPGKMGVNPEFPFLPGEFGGAVPKPTPKLKFR